MLLRDNIYAMIRHGILSLEFQPGQELREQLLAARYRVSRSPIRDALLRLGQEGFVTVLPRQGYRVNTISARDVEAMYDLCLLLEPACAAGAARAEDAAVATLDRFREFDDDDSSSFGFIDHNCSFHAAIADMCGNARLALIEHNLGEEFGRLLRYSMPSIIGIDMRQLVIDHDAIIDAIQAHDTQKAAKLAEEHIVTWLMPVIEAFRDNIEISNGAAPASSMPE